MSIGINHSLNPITMEDVGGQISNADHQVTLSLILRPYVILESPAKQFSKMISQS